MNTSPPLVYFARTGMKLKTVSIGKERFVYTDRKFTIPGSAVRQMIEMLEKWSLVSPHEPTYVMRNYGVPSLLARFDGVIDENDQFQAYEIQGGCGWVGYAGVANGAFRKMRDTFAREIWPSFKLLMPPVYHNDDELWLKRTNLKEALLNTDPLMIRRWLFRELDAETRTSLIGRSVKPMFYQNDKRYGIELGWWKRVTWQHGEEELLPWDDAFVLKPLKNQGSSDIMIWVPTDRKGRATRTQINNTLKRHGTMYLQRFIPPMRMDIEGRKYNMMLRPFFGYDPSARKWIPMHGVWVARPHPNLRLHGSSDAISGPLFMQ